MVRVPWVKGDRARQPSLCVSDVRYLCFIFNHYYSLRVLCELSMTITVIALRSLDKTLAYS